MEQKTTIEYIFHRLIIDDSPSHADAYKEQFVKWRETTTKVVRPNVECTNGIIHLVDKVFIDNSPPWTVGKASQIASSSLLLTALALILSTNMQ